MDLLRQGSRPQGGSGSDRLKDDPKLAPLRPRADFQKLVKDLDQGLEGRDLLVVEDIVDTGLTLNYLLNVLRARGPRTLKVAALLSKPSRRLVQVNVDYIGFTIEDLFVVGYGLDYNEKYRNLADIVVYGG